MAELFMFKCKQCKAVLPHRKVLEVGITTRYRINTITTYRCEMCNALHNETDEKQIENPQIWD